MYFESREVQMLVILSTTMSISNLDTEQPSGRAQTRDNSNHFIRGLDMKILHNAMLHSNCNCQTR
jgi:hypothetical protein